MKPSAESCVERREAGAAMLAQPFPSFRIAEGPAQFPCVSVEAEIRPPKALVAISGVCNLHMDDRDAELLNRVLHYMMSQSLGVIGTP